MILGYNLGSGQAVEQGRFAGVGIANQCNHGIGHVTAGLAVQLSRPHHGLQLPAQAHHPIVDQAPVRFDLGFTGAANGAQATTLAFEMGPGTNQTAALIGQLRQFDLQPPFLGVGPIRKNF